MQNTFPWLSLSIWIPILFGILILGLGRDRAAPLVRTLALELAPAGVTVNAVLPGMVETEKVAAMPADVRERVLGAVPFKRFATLDDRIGRQHRVEQSGQHARVSLDELGVNAGDVDLAHVDVRSGMGPDPLDDLQQARPAVGDGERVDRVRGEPAHEPWLVFLGDHDDLPEPLDGGSLTEQGRHVQVARGVRVAATGQRLGDLDEFDTCLDAGERDLRGATGGGTQRRRPACRYGRHGRIGAIRCRPDGRSRRSRASRSRHAGHRLCSPYRPGRW